MTVVSLFFLHLPALIAEIYAIMDYRWTITPAFCIFGHSFLHEFLPDPGELSRVSVRRRRNSGRSSMLATPLMVLVTLKMSASPGTMVSVRFLDGSNSGMMHAEPFRVHVWHEHFRSAFYARMRCIQVP